jgi:hypothetical protein
MLSLEPSGQTPTFDIPALVRKFTARQLRRISLELLAFLKAFELPSAPKIVAFCQKIPRDPRLRAAITNEIWGQIPDLPVIFARH